MRIVFDINHPADVHTFKNLIHRLKGEAHQILVTVRQKNNCVELLRENQIDYIERPSGSGFYHRLFNGFRIVRFLYLRYKHYNPDILFGGPGNLYIAQLGKLLHKPSIILDDTEHTAIQNWLTFPFATQVWTPQCFQLNLGRRQRRFNGSKELAYLHPNHYEFNKAEFETHLFRLLSFKGKAELLNSLKTRLKPVILIHLKRRHAFHDLFHSGFVDIYEIIQDTKKKAFRYFLSKENVHPNLNLTIFPCQRTGCMI